MKKLNGDHVDEAPVDGDEAFQARYLMEKIGVDAEQAREIVANYRGSWTEMEAEAHRVKAQG